jgi:hypothetical protein
MSIADYFEKQAERTLRPGVDADAARRQFQQALWLIGAILVVVIGAFLIRTPSDGDLRPRGAYAVSAAGAEREAGHGPANFGTLPARLDPRPPTLRQGLDETQIAKSELGKP